MEPILTRLRNHQAQKARKPEMEIIYRELFLRELERCSVPDTFYPVGGAANHSLLYFLARLLQEFEFRQILELGAGQSSILIDQIKQRIGASYDALTIEHDAAWSERIGAQVHHQVLRVELCERSVLGHKIHYYEVGKEIIPAPVDLLLIDGPPAEGDGLRYSRLGILDFLEAALGPDPRDFVIVVDDCDRCGEKLLARKLQESFWSNNVAIGVKTICAAKCQTVIAAGKYANAIYLA